MPSLRFSLRQETREMRGLTEEAGRAARASRGALAFAGPRMDAIQAGRRLRALEKEIQTVQRDASAALRLWAVAQSAKAVLSGEGDKVSAALLGYEGVNFAKKYLVKGGFWQLTKTLGRVGTVVGGPAGALGPVAFALMDIEHKQKQIDDYFHGAERTDGNPLLKKIDPFIGKAARKQFGPGFFRGFFRSSLEDDKQKIREGLTAIASQPELVANMLGVDITELARRGAAEQRLDVGLLSRHQLQQAMMRGSALMIAERSDMSAVEVGLALREGRLPVFGFGGKFIGMTRSSVERGMVTGEIRVRAALAAEERTQHRIQADRKHRVAVAKAYD